MIREGRSFNGYKPSEYMVSKKCLAAWSELCLHNLSLLSDGIFYTWGHLFDSLSFSSSTLIKNKQVYFFLLNGDTYC